MIQRNFKEIYDKIYANVGQQVEKNRKSSILKTIYSILIIFIIWIMALYFSVKFRMYLVFILSVIGAAGFLTYYSLKVKVKYTSSFKQLIINEIVKQSNPNLKFMYGKGINSSIYRSSDFETTWDKYSSEDRIEGIMEDGSELEMAQVHTEEVYVYTDSNGHTQRSYTTKFFGLFGCITLKTPTNANFIIMNNSKLSKFDKKRIEMESSEFEKYYDVYPMPKNSGMRQSVMEILTPDAIEKFVEIRNLFKKPINVRVYNNKIYFRINLGDIFEAPTFKSSTNYNLLYRYFLMIDVPRMIYEALIDNILIMYGDNEAREKRNLLKSNESKNN